MNNKLEKRYGLLTAISMVVGIVIGSGVFFKAEVVLARYLAQWKGYEQLPYIK